MESSALKVNFINKKEQCNMCLMRKKNYWLNICYLALSCSTVHLKFCFIYDHQRVCYSCFEYVMPKQNQFKLIDFNTWSINNIECSMCNANHLNFISAIQIMYEEPKRRQHMTASVRFMRDQFKKTSLYYSNIVKETKFLHIKTFI